MNLYQQFKTDDRVEQEGIDLDFGSCKIRIARAGGGNTRYAKMLAERLKPYRRQIDKGTMDNDLADRIFAEVYAQSVIIGWENVTDEKGKKLPYTTENCVKLLTDLPELFREIQEQANKVANFRAEELEEDIKN